MTEAARRALKKTAEKNFKENLEKQKRQKKLELEELERLKQNKEENNAVK